MWEIKLAINQTVLLSVSKENGSRLTNCGIKGVGNKVGNIGKNR